MSFETWTDPIVSWIGAAGMASYVVYIHRHRTRSALEVKMLLLLYCLAALFLVRGFYWATDDVRLQVPAFVPATLLPLAITLFVEALMRRHASPVLKVFVALGTVVFFVLNLSPILSREDLFTGYKLFALTTIAWLGLVLLARKRKSHSLMENRFIDGITAALALTFLLALTDLQIRPDWLHFRVGSIGGLLFVYVCLRWTNARESPGTLGGEILGMVLEAGVATGAFGLVVGRAEADLYVAIFFVALALVLLAAILDRIRSQEALNRDTSFFRWLVRARAGSLDELIESLDGLPLAKEHRVLRERDLEGYRPDVMARAFCEDEPVLTLSALRAKQAAGNGSPDAAEQLVDLLERHGMTHVTLLSEDPAVFLLLTLPDFAGTHNPVLQVALLQKYGRLLDAAPRALALVLLALAGTGCGPAGRLMRGYAEGDPATLAEVLHTSGSPGEDAVHAGMARFAFDDMGSLDTEGLERHTVPWKVVAAALVLRAHDLRGAPVHPRTLEGILSDVGFVFPSEIRNWQGPQPRLDGPLGLLTAMLSRNAPRVELEAANIGCAACHAGVLHDRSGMPTRAAWLGIPNTSLDLEAYAVEVFEALRHFQGREERLRETMDALFPRMSHRERRTIRRYALPPIRARFSGEWIGRDSPLPFVNGSPGVTNGIGALKNILGMLGDDARGTEVGFTSIPAVSGRSLRSSLLYDGAYTVPDRSGFEAMDRAAVTGAHLDDLADITTFFIVPALGISPERAREAYPRIRQVVEYLHTLRPPPFPAPVDTALARAGEAVYGRACASCHGEFAPVGSEPGPLRLERFPNRLVPQDEMGTDPHRWRLADSAFAARVAATPYGRYIHARTTGGYVAPPLSALWATAPYLHNGSVPTLWHLMHPDRRPERFLAGGHALDFERMGIAGELDGRGIFVYPEGYEPRSRPALYDTALPGRSRAGHEAEFGRLSEPEKRALLEYLKLL